MSLKHFEVTGQKALLVTARRSIGKGIALAFAEAGADVAMVPISPGRLGLWTAESASNTPRASLNKR